MDVVVVQPAEAKIEPKKLPRFFWVGLDVAAILFWSYATLKVFVFDIDVYLISLVTPEFVWLLNYKFLILLSLVFVAMLITRSFSFSSAGIY